MTAKRLISIITVCFNSEKTIEDTLRSVVEQNYGEIEYIVIDGASTDQTLTIINKYATHIHKLVSEPDKGIYDAYNKGLEVASGEVIYYLNSDDYLCDSTVIEDVMKQFNINQDLAFLAANVIQYDQQLDYQRQVASDFTLTDIYGGAIPQCPAFFASRAMYSKHGNYSLDYLISSDYEWFIKCYLSDYENGLYLDRNISMFRIGGISTNPENIKLMWQEKLSIMEKAFGLEHMENYKLNSPRYFFQNYWSSHDLPITQGLIAKGINKVAIFGTLEAADYLFQDLEKAGIKTLVFIDNNLRKQQLSFHGLAVRSSVWLTENHQNIDAVIISVLNEHNNEVRNLLIEATKQSVITIYNYTQIIELAKN